MVIKIFKTYKTKTQKKANHKELLLGLSSGILLGLSFPPIPLPYLLFVGLLPYLIVLENRKTLAEINRFTYFTVFFFNLITLYWVGSWTPDADPFLMIAGSVLMFFNPIVFLIPSTLYYFVRKSLGKNTALFLLPWFWLFYEYIYSITDFKFPWLSLSNGLPYFTSYIQIADIIGSYGLTVLVIYANIFAYLSWKSFKDNKFKLKLVVMFFLIILLPIVYGVYKINSYKGTNAKVKVGLIQPNLNPNKKWEIGNLNEQIDLYTNMSLEAINQGAELIIWPETALPVYLLTSRYKDEKQKIQSFADSLKISIMTGMPHAKYYFNPETAPKDAKPLRNSKALYTSYNSILFFAPNKNIDQYGKIKLVPFGEKVPLVEDFPFLGKWIKWNVGISSWNTGQDTVIFNYQDNESKSIGIAGVICIEAIYPDFISAFVNKGAEFISVVTNDSWYGNSSGPYQHKEIQVLRAVENRRSLARAANGGISCIVNPLGITEKETKMFTRDILVGNVEIRSELTFFTVNPLILPYISIFISVLVSIISFYKKIILHKLIK